MAPRKTTKARACPAAAAKPKAQGTSYHHVFDRASFNDASRQSQKLRKGLLFLLELWPSLGAHSAL
jgi:hypothetical protein